MNKPPGGTILGAAKTHRSSKWRSQCTNKAAPRNFEDDVLPHLDAAYNLARWLTRNDQDAENVVQEASLRALRFFGGFRGDNARAWFLKIVRNSYLARLQEKQGAPPTTPFDEFVRGSRLKIDDECGNKTLLLAVNKNDGE